MNTTPHLLVARRFREARDALGWRNLDIAARFGVTPATVSYCMQGRIPAPEHVLRWMEERAAIVAAHRPSPPWRWPEAPTDRRPAWRQAQVL